jgi:uncharacterized protein YkwD
MKTLITPLLFFIPFFIQCQMIDINNVDYNKLNTKVFNKINNYRKTMNIDTLIYSSVVNEKVSKVNTSKMVENNKLYHPGYSITDQAFVSKLSEEYIKITKNKCFEGKVKEYVSISRSGEIILSTTCDENNCLTYDEFAESCLNSWLSSPPHKKILISSYKNFSGVSGLASCNVAKKEGTFYVAFNFFQVIYF